MKFLLAILLVLVVLMTLLPTLYTALEPVLAPGTNFAVHTGHYRFCAETGYECTETCAHCLSFVRSPAMPRTLSRVVPTLALLVVPGLLALYGFARYWSRGSG